MGATPAKVTYYSAVVPGSERKENGPIRRFYEYKSYPTAISFFGCYTVYEMFRRGVELGLDGPCLGYRPIDSSGKAGPYVFFTYREIDARINMFASGLMHLNLMPPNPDGMRLLGIYMKNCIEWTISEHACYTQSAATVPLYDTLGPDTVEYVVNQTGLTTIVCKETEVSKLIQVKPKCPTLRTLIFVSPISSGTRLSAEAAGFQTYAFEKVEMIGSQQPHTHAPPAPHHIATFCYTSGTTGQSKGALVTHQNLVSGYTASSQVGLLLGPGDSYLSYLPQPHIYERVCQVGVLGSGAAIGFYQGDPLKIVEDLQALRPTLFAAVPRLLNKIYDKIMMGVEEVGGLKAALFNRALNTKLQNMRDTGVVSHALWDRLVFKKVKIALGMDRLKRMVSGSAPLAPHVMDFFRVVLGIPVHEGYGQTEGSAVCTVSHPDDMSSGHVGGPLPCCEIKLVDVPEMGYYHTDTLHGDKNGNGVLCEGRGEICLRGPHVFAGYYKMPEETRSTVDSDGWLHSGDIGLWTKDGNLKIIDRKKNIFKLSQGEYVAAEKIENVLGQSPFVAQSFVYGDSFQSVLVGIIVPEEEVVRAYLSKMNDPLATASFKEICQSSALRETIFESISAVSAAAELHGFEMVKAIYLESELFTVESEILTPTFKLKRNVASTRYKDIIDGLYASLGAAPTADRAKKVPAQRSRL